MNKKIIVLLLLFSLIFLFTGAGVAREETARELRGIENVLRDMLRKIDDAERSGGFVQYPVVDTWPITGGPMPLNGGAVPSTPQTTTPRPAPAPAPSPPPVVTESGPIEGIPKGFSFMYDMSLGSGRIDVRYLQILLNYDNDTKLASSGAGSPGNETSFFGPITKRAVKKFQEKYKGEVLSPLGLDEGTGYVGFRTRQKMNAILRGEVVISPGSDPSPDPEPDPDPEPEPDPEPDPEEDYILEIPDVENPCGGSRTFVDHRNSERYSLVEIGPQCWMKENLNYDLEGSWCYNNESENCDKYGRLYGFEMAEEVCPTGWKLPSDKDFKIMEVVLGMSKEDAHEEGWRGEGIGEKIKSAADWNGSDASGFSAIPGGGRESSGNFYGIDNGASFWTSTASGTSSWTRNLFPGRSTVNRSLLSKGNAISVRCIKEL